MKALARLAALVIAAAVQAAPALAADGCEAAPLPSVRADPISLPPNMRVGVALGSGSVHGLAHVGVLEELESRGLDVSVVAGTSVGALVGSLWASGVSAPDIERLARATHWDELGRMSTSFEGLFTNDALRAELAPFFKGRPIEAWPRRFGAVATNIANGHRRVFMSGDGALAVQASSAVPFAYAPVKVDGERYADGALVEPLPVETARDMGANWVVAVDVAYRPYEAPASGLAGNTFQAMHILINSLAEREARGADFVIRLDLHGHMMKCGNDALIAMGREAMYRAWPALAAALRERSAEMALAAP